MPFGIELRFWFFFFYRLTQLNIRAKPACSDGNFHACFRIKAQ